MPEIPTRLYEHPSKDKYLVAETSVGCFELPRSNPLGWVLKQPFYGSTASLKRLTPSDDDWQKILCEIPSRY